MNNKNENPHPLAGKMVMRGYTELATRLGIPRSSAVRLVQTGKITLLEEQPGRIVAWADQVKERALAEALRIEADYKRSLDRALIARVMNDPEKSSDREMCYALARVEGKDFEELYYYFNRRSAEKPGFLQKKYDEERQKVQEIVRKFPEAVNVYNPKTGGTETVLRAPQPLTIPPEE